ncbi:cysteine proteinase [Dendrothele bispora CBS 962.96]|uniref:Cysteine proteinase n=1 Tax=Dendrothele bispora (strain CBS 962.96) TaxID=1314807 RepID=A0A4S8M9E1_DENBC|nr:cysteine proteinase [Dendrothele bispora CBS 962.96]
MLPDRPVANVSGSGRGNSVPLQDQDSPNRRSISLELGANVVSNEDLTSLSKGDPEEVILYYPWEGVDGVQLYRQDYRQLEPPGFLDDSVIEIGLKMFQTRLKDINPDLMEQIYIFTPFFYPVLSENSPEVGYSQVRSWTDADKVDIFQKKYLVIPINQSFHWFLAIIYHPEYALSEPKEKLQSSIWTLDPLGFERPEVINLLSFYLKSEAQEKRGVTVSNKSIIGVKGLIPIQPNWYDCGPYILVFVKTFMESPEEFLEMIATDDTDLEKLMRWKSEEFEEIRGFLQVEICRLAKEWSSWQKEKEK